MKILDFVPANCKNCYKCVRNCSVKAIKMVDDRAQIEENRCVACGTCFLVSPQNARSILSDLDKVLQAVKANKKVIISIAPSYLGIYKEPYKLIGALKKIGVHAVEETSIGAVKTTELYREYIKKANGKIMITTACPSVNLMVQTYFPELLDNLMPIDSPMIAHSKMLRQKYGKDSYITFLGPCIAKKCEAYPYQVAGIMDAVISFEEIEEYLSLYNINLDDCEEIFPDATGGTTGQRYPIEKGILAGLADVLNDKEYTSIAVAGSKNCKNLFEALRDNKLSNICIEANMCEGACMGGPAISKVDGNSYVRQVLIRNKIKQNEKEKKNFEDINNNIDYSRKFRDKHIQAPKGRLILPQVQTIRDLLDNKCIVVSVTTDNIECGLAALSKPPKLIITDSQVFKTVYEKKPAESLLTSFSVLFAALKGDIEEFVNGSNAIDSLTENSRVLIAEACTHAPLSEDIGREKIPNMLRKKIGEGLKIDVVSGVDFPDDLSKYDLIIHCASCMFNKKYVLSRINKAKEKGVPISNYGIVIAKMVGILDKIKI